MNILDETIQNPSDPLNPAANNSNNDETDITKTSSARRIAASRSNGARSQGPTTPEGRAIALANLKDSPRNFRHGMLAQTVVLASESRERFEELLDSLIAEHHPTTRTERGLVELIAVARWRLMRTWTIQKQCFDAEVAKHQNAAPTIAPIAATKAYRSLNEDDRTFSASHKHEATYERQYLRALRELKRLQDLNKTKPGSEKNTASSYVTSTWEDAAETFDLTLPETTCFSNLEPSPKNEQ